MNNGFIKHWWKLLGVLILLYVFSAGFIVPLKPGVISLVPTSILSGKSSNVTISAYNSHFDELESGDIKAFLKIDSVHVIQATSVTAINRKTLDVAFDVPYKLPNNSEFERSTLVIYNTVDGYMVTPSALTVQQGDAAENTDSFVTVRTWNDQITLAEVPWTFSFPFRGILYETIRNTFFHVAIWFAMFILLIVSLVYSVKYLNTKSLYYDAVAASFTHVAIGFGLIGMATGSVWAKSAWGAYWTNDPKLNMSVVSLMIYIAYAILRSSFTADDRRAQVSAAYNIFAFCAMIPLIFIIPRLTSSLHPGNGGNPALGGEDLDNTLRMIFYPSIIGLSILGVWMSSLLYRVRKLEIIKIEKQLST